MSALYTRLKEARKRVGWMGKEGGNGRKGKGRNTHVRLYVCCLDLVRLVLVRLNVGSCSFAGRSLLTRRGFDEVSDDSVGTKRERERSELDCCCFL